MKTSIEPSPDRIEQLTALPDDGKAIVMINLLRFREQAGYPSDFEAAPCSGREAYQRYGVGVGPLIGQAKGRVLWMGSVALSAIAPEGEEWDDAVLVQYPTKQAFLDMIASPDYQAVSPHRTAALADSRLIATRTLVMGFGEG